MQVKFLFVAAIIMFLAQFISATPHYDVDQDFLDYKVFDKFTYFDLKKKHTN